MEILEENPRLYPNMRGAGARYRCGTSVIGTMIQTSDSLGRSDGDGRRL